MFPSDYRYNPFSDVPTGVQTVERHVIPSKSPFVVVLNEIPQRDAPSTLKVKEILTYNSDGSTSYGAPFAEVAATPAAGQVWPDYNTKADKTAGWNTGRLLFNATEAGKMIEVTYKATGTLAGVASNRFPAWWTDRGDGSDGAFIPTEDTIISGLKNYTYVYIPAGVTVTAENLTDIKVQDSVVVDGTIQARRPKDGAPLGLNILSKGGRSHVNSRGESPKPADEPRYYGSFDIPDDSIELSISRKEYFVGGNPGKRSDGKVDKAGGGCLYITASNVLVRGNINANGDSGTTNLEYDQQFASGGGGGGLLVIVAATSSGGERCTARGGEKGDVKKTHYLDGTWRDATGPGTDGRVKIIELGTGV